MHILSTLTYLLCQLEKKATMWHGARGRGVVSTERCTADRWWWAPQGTGTWSALYHHNLHLAFHCKRYPSLGSKATCPEAQFNLWVLAWRPAIPAAISLCQERPSTTQRKHNKTSPTGTMWSQTTAGYLIS